MTDMLIATLPKNSREEIRVSLTEYQGHRLCAVRVYFDPEDGGERRPGKSGLNVRVSMLPDLIAALQAADAEARAAPRARAPRATHAHARADA